MITIPALVLKTWYGSSTSEASPPSAETCADDSTSALLEENGSGDSIAFSREFSPTLHSIMAMAGLPEELSQEAIDKISQCLGCKVHSTVITLLQDQTRFSRLPLLRQQLAETLDQLRLTIQPNPCQSQMEKITAAILQQAKQLAVKIATMEKRRAINEWFKGEPTPVDQLTGNALDMLYNQYQSDKRLANSVANKLDNLINLANIPERFQQQYTLAISHTHNDDNPNSCFVINVAPGNYALGYGIFDLLRSQAIPVSQHEDYDGRTTFPLSRTHFKKLSEHIEQLYKWYDDFLCIVGDLLGREDAEAGDASTQFVSIGKKNVREILNNPIHLSAHCQTLFATLAERQPCLLFNTLSINLTHHSDRHFLRQKFESIYQEEYILGSDHLKKKFLRGTFRTNLSVHQLRVISPHLNKLLKLQQLLTDVTHTDSLGKAVFAYRAQGLGENEIDSLKSFKTSLLYEIYQEIKGPDEQSYLRISRSFKNVTQITLLEAIAYEWCESILRNESVCCFPESACQPTIDDRKIFTVYGDHERNITYAGQQIHRNISALINALQNSKAYRQYKSLNPDIDEALSILKNDLLCRLNRYSNMLTHSANSRYMLDEAIDYLETFVSLLCHSDDYRLGQSSISNAFDNLAAIADSGLYGCNQGLSGRIQSLLLPLIASTGDRIKDSIVQFQKDSITAALARVIGDSNESSMWARCLDEVNNFLGLAVVKEHNPNISFNDLSQTSKHTISHLLHRYYTPVSLYRHIYQFVSDEFWRLNHEKNDDEIYQLLESLGFGDNRHSIDRKYRVRGNPLKRWQYAFFQQDLPKYLVHYLKNEKFIGATAATESTIYIPRDALLFGNRTVMPHYGEPDESGQNDRQLGFVPESRLTQQSYPTGLRHKENDSH